MDPPSPWKTPSEVMRLHKLKKRKKALQERMKQPCASVETIPNQNQVDLDFSRILNGDKRRNPFSKNSTEQNKKIKLESSTQLDESSDKTLFALLNLPANAAAKPPVDVGTDKLSTFSNLLQKFTADHTVETPVESHHNRLTIDWALKTKLRLMSPKPFPWTTKLKASEEASGITGFVRCLDTSSSPTLDTSPRALFHQTCLYWQHPHLPWLNLFPRSSGKVTATSFIATNEEIKQALQTEWAESFRSLFQLLRTRHCPYFYVCANSFTILFLAAGVGGCSEPMALVTPTTRGFRNSLRQEDVEYTMPLRPEIKRTYNASDEDRGRNSSFDSSYDTMDDLQSKSCSGDEEDPDEFLSQIGLEIEEIRKINNAQSRLALTAQTRLDAAAESLCAVRGAEAQALAAGLLQRRLAARAGALAGVPPTLLAPTAFLGAALAALAVHENTIISDGKKYYSIELRGPILPTTVHALFNVLKTNTSAQFSATFAHHQPTLAFTWAARKIAEDDSLKENEPNHFSKAFNKVNLSDCGISEEMLQLFCSPDASYIKSLDSVKYNSEDNTYMW